MNFQYRFRLPVPVEQAWPVLLDLRRVAPCMPGASIESGEGDDYVGRMKVKLGPIEMAYRGDLHFVERDDAGHRLKLEGTGKEIRGGGGARAVTTMEATPLNGACEIAIVSDYSLSGRAAQFGTGMIDEIGTKLMKEFVTRLERLIATGAGAPPLAQPEVTRASPVATPGSESTSTPVPVQSIPHMQENEALDLVGLAWGPLVSRVLPVAHFLVSIAILVFLIIHR